MEYIVSVFSTMTISGVVNTIVLGFIGVLVLAAGRKLYEKSKNSKETKKKASSVLSSIGYGQIASDLNEYELTIASQLVDPSEIDVTFDDIAGLEHVVDAIEKEILLPLQINSVIKSKSQFLQPPKGLLLYGPPGCGKTMIAKATAKAAKANFLNLQVPTLTNKWYGESQKLSSAVFTLAEKLQPCIIFIDEIDTFLRSRSKDDHEATAMMKAQFMILWDGLSSLKNDCNIMVLGATNRLADVDEAIRRRMPKKFEIPLPTRDQRKSILEHLLRGEPLETDVDLGDLANSTEEFSSSDLKELCRNAVFARISEQSSILMDVLSEGKGGDIGREMQELISKLRNVKAKDFEVALVDMKSSKSDINKSKADGCMHSHSHV